MRSMVICLTCIICFPFVAYCNSDESATIVGKINGETSTIKEVKVLFCEKFVYGIDNIFDTTLIPTKDGFFSIKLSLNKAIGKVIQLVLVYNTMINQFSYDHDILSNFLIQPGDSVNFSILVNSKSIRAVHVSGRGWQKYQCQADIDLQDFEFNKERNAIGDFLGKAWWNVQNLPRIYETFESYQTKMLKILNSYENGISENITRIMKADVIASVRGAWELQISDYYSRIDSAQKDDVKNFYFQHTSNDNISDRNVLAYSPDYIEYIFQKELNLLSYKKGIPNNGLALSDIYFNLRNNYSGELRERLLMLLIVDPTKNDKLIALDDDKKIKLINDALKLVKTADLKEKIRNCPIVKARAGEKAYNFNLPDTAGKNVSLANLKGSVILFELWYTGCTGCSHFNERFRTEVMPYLKNNSSFKIVSICVDDQKEIWLKSLYSGKYTSPENINLYLPFSEETSGKKAPMLDYYGLEGLPFILLIDKKGRIVSQFTNTTKTEHMIALIEKVLEKL